MITDNPHHSRRWTILAILAIAQLMVVVDATIVTIALPSAQRALHFASSERQWIVTAYALAFGSLLLLGGRISDLLGRKWTFIAGLAGFATASAVGGAAQSFEMLAAARASQGAFAALLAPAALSLMTTTFTDPGERNKAFGIWGAIAGSGAAIGLILGGVLTQTLSWRYSMYVNLIFATIAITGALALLHNQAPAVKPKLDIPGVLSVSAGLSALVYGFSHAQTTSWRNHTTIAFLITGALLLALFAVIQSRSRNPLLPLRIVTDRNRGASFLSIGIVGAAVFAVFLFLTYYLQQVRGYTPIRTGVAFLPISAAVMFAAIIATNKLRPRLGPRPLAVTGNAAGQRRNALPDPADPGLELRHRHPAGTDHDRHRDGPGVLHLDQQRHPRRQASRRRGRVGDRVSLPADRRLARHRAALDGRRQRTDRLHHQRPRAPHRAAARARRRARRHHGVRVGRRVLRGGRRDRGSAVRARHESTQDRGDGRARDRPLTTPSDAGPARVYFSTGATSLGFDRPRHG